MSIEFKLFNDDCVNILQDYLGKIDLIITSPPYDDLREYGGHEFKFQEVAYCISKYIEARRDNCLECLGFYVQFRIYRNKHEAMFIFYVFRTNTS